MPMHPGQREIIKDQMIVDLLETIYDKEGKNDDGEYKFGRIMWAIFHHERSAWGDKENQKRKDECGAAYRQLKSFHQGAVSLKSTFGNQTPTLVELRLVIYDIIIEFMHEKYPNRRNNFPILETPVSTLTGMDKIRFLFNQYLSLTMPGSMERYKLAHEILIEKRLLGLPCKHDDNVSIYDADDGYAPGDFHYLDFSKMHFSRDSALESGNFKTLDLSHCHLDGMTLEIPTIGAQYRNSSMKGVFIAQEEMSVFEGANVDGMYCHREDWAPTRSAINAATVSKSIDALIEYRSAVLGPVDDSTLNYFKQLKEQLKEKQQKEEANFMAAAIAEVNALSTTSVMNAIGVSPIIPSAEGRQSLSIISSDDSDISSDDSEEKAQDPVFALKEENARLRQELEQMKEQMIRLQLRSQAQSANQGNTEQKDNQPRI